MNDIRKILESLENIDPKTDIEDIFLGDLKGAPESDTNVEKQIEIALYNYIKHADDQSKQTLIPILKQLRKFKNLYPSDLKSDKKYQDNQYVYRGTRIDDYEVYSELIHQIAYRKQWGEEYEFLDYTYYPTYELQSWSTIYNVAEDFALSKRYKYSGIIRTTIDDTFIMSADIINALSLSAHNSREYEVFRLSKEPLNAEIKLIKGNDEY